MYDGGEKLVYSAVRVHPALDGWGDLPRFCERCFEHPHREMNSNPYSISLTILYTPLG
jgi:hypothetical protein